MHDGVNNRVKATVFVDACQCVIYDYVDVIRESRYVIQENAKAKKAIEGLLKQSQNNLFRKLTKYIGVNNSNN